MNNSLLSELPVPEANYDPAWDDRFGSGMTPLTPSEDWPRLSIVTPSFNQGRFMEKTIRCILLQGYPNLEYIIVDGGSTDQSLKIIEKYAPWISEWTSEPDSGMYNAINKGFEKSTGDIMAWSPTGDLYEPDSLRMVGRVFQQFTEIEWLTSLFKIKCDESGNETARYRVSGFCDEAFQKGLNFPGGNRHANFTIQQQSTFWRRCLWDRSGGHMDESMRGAGDFELWARFFRYAEIYTLDSPVGIFRSHDGQESVEHLDRILQEQSIAFKRHGGKHIGGLENWFRRNVLSRTQSKVFPWKLRIGAYKGNIVRWDNKCGSGEIKVKDFY